MPQVLMGGCQTEKQTIEKLWSAGRADAFRRQCRSDPCLEYQRSGALTPSDGPQLAWAQH